jgi:methionyl-tRNA formyltransferase
MEKKDLKIVFLGTPDFAVESLRRLVEGGYNVVGVVTMPDKPAGRGHKMLHSPVKQYAEANGLYLMQPPKLKAPEFVDELRALDADLFIVIAFRMLPEVVWSMPHLGTFNLHASLLPRYRGAAPINWAVMNGDKTTGVTTFFLKHEIDTGDVIDQKSIEIGDDECVGDVHDRLMMLGADLTISTVDRILAGNLTAMPQDTLAGEPTAAPKIFKETCQIDWNRLAREVHNHVRGLSPYPAAWTLLPRAEGDELNVKVFATRLTNMPCVAGTCADVDCAAPGAVRVDGGHLYVATADNWIEILSLQPAGKRRMEADEFLRGYHLKCE